MEITREIKVGDLILLKEFETEIAEGGTYIGYHPPHLILKVFLQGQETLGYEALVEEKTEVVWRARAFFKDSLIIRGQTKYKFEAIKKGDYKSP